MMYLLQGKLKSKQGKQKELSEILLAASKLVSAAKGCELYIVSKSPEDDQLVFITEIWKTKEDHDNSLKVEGVKDLIMKAMPILDGPPKKGEELEILGGFKA